MVEPERKLIHEALRFAVWAAGEGICPVYGEPASAPEDFLMDYSIATDDVDWEGLANRIYTHLSHSEAQIAERVKLDPDMPEQQLRMHLGEMTAQELRTARAAIRLANSALSALEPAAPIVNRPTHCGGCGETEPAKRCIGCLADFGPASHQQQETADEIADETVETAVPMFQFRIGDGELVFEIPGSIIVSVEPDGAGYAFFDHETNQWVSGKHLIAEDIEAAGMEIAKALAGTCDAYDKGHYDGIADAVKLGTAVLAGAEAPATSYENLDNFLKQLEALVSPAWQPIETAPKDGRAEVRGMAV